MSPRGKITRSPSQPRLPLISDNLNDLLEEYTSRLEKKVAIESRFFRLMADAMPQIVWTALPSGKPDYFNQRWYEYTGLGEKESLASSPLGITHPDDVKKSRKVWREALKTGSPYEAEFRLRDHASGEYRWFLGRAIAGRDAGGKIIKWFGTCTDIDEHKKAQEKKDEFIAITSHELKTPLTSIKAFSQILEMQMQRKGDNDSLVYVSKISEQIDRLTKLIKELLDISLLDTGKLKLQQEDFDFDQFIKQALDNIQLVNPSHKLILKGKTGKTVSGDKDRIEQVLINLISNGVKYSPKADKIIIRLAADKKEVKVEVEDFGIGIPKNEQKNIFERFFRVGGEQRKTFAGLGLGLYISREIIRREGGKIWVESDRGGSKFIFTLPIKKPRKK